MPADGGATTQITTPTSDGGSHIYPVWLPDGRRVVFGHVPAGGGYAPDGIWVMEREAPGRPWGEPRLVIAFDRPEPRPHLPKVGSDWIYLTVGATESDIWVARVVGR